MNYTYSFTGHRPGKLWGYNYNHPSYIKLKEYLKTHMFASHPYNIITGMALGFDQIVALAAIEYKLLNPNSIFIEAAIPCRDHPCKWNFQSIKLYNKILSKCDKVTLVTDKPYSPYLMQVRNQYMIDNSDCLVALWNGDKSGGTYNAIKYAKYYQKKIIYIDPILFQ